MDARRQRSGRGAIGESPEKQERAAVGGWRIEALEATCRLLAREGDYLEAEHRLCNWMSLYTETVGLLDLIARIYAQQGKYDEARQSWRKAERLDPGNPRYLAALRKLRDLERPRRKLPMALPSARAVIIALVVIIFALVASIAWLHRNALPKGAKHVPASVKTQNAPLPSATGSQGKTSPPPSAQSSPAEVRNR
jgi:tetratricopeptide (TPR) repeat protein